MDTVNPQITDAVTQANVRTLGSAPATAMSSIYNDLAHSIGLAFQNAVSAQQQWNVLSQAATTQGIMQLYSADTASTAHSPPLSDTSVGESIAQAHGQAQAALLSSSSALNQQVVQAIAFSNAATLDNADAFAHALRVSTAAAAAALDSLNRITLESQSAMLKTAARTACIACMLRAPEKAADFAQVLERIDALS